LDFINNDFDKPNSHCDEPICELLKSLTKHTICDFGIGIEGTKQKLFVLNKGTSQPISVDGTDPTVFTLENFDPKDCLAVFSFKKEELDSSVGVTNVKGTLVIDCNEIGGLLFLKKQDDDDL